MARPDARDLRRLERALGGVTTLALAGLICIGVGIYGALDPGESPAWVYLATFLPLGAAFLGSAALVVARRRPREAEGVRVSATGEAARGGRVEATVTLERTSPWPVRAGLVCRERYDLDHLVHDADGGSRLDTVTHEALAHEDWRELHPQAASHELVFEVPAAAPYSHDGAVVQWHWEVVVEQRDGAGGRPRTATATVQVRP